MKYCPNCGTKFKEGADICLKCGKLIARNKIVEKQTTGNYAGFWKRFASYTIDGIILGGAGFVMGFISGFVIGLLSSSNPLSADSYTWIGNAISLLLGWLYYTLMETSIIQGTLGKKLVGIKVTDLNGNRITFGRATARFFGKIISAFIFCIGFFMAGWTEKKQALHDIMAETLVVDR